LCEACIAKCCPAILIGDVAEELNEDIDNYWNSLDEDDRNWSIKEEEHAKTLLVSQLLTED